MTATATDICNPEQMARYILNGLIRRIDSLERITVLEKAPGYHNLEMSGYTAYPNIPYDGIPGAGRQVLRFDDHFHVSFNLSDKDIIDGDWDKLAERFLDPCCRAFIDKFEERGDQYLIFTELALTNASDGSREFVVACEDIGIRVHMSYEVRIQSMRVKIETLCAFVSK